MKKVFFSSVATAGSASILKDGQYSHASIFNIYSPALGLVVGRQFVGVH